MKHLNPIDYAHQSFGDDVIANLRADLTSEQGFSSDVLEFIYGQKLLRVGLPDFAGDKPLNPYQIAKVFEALAYVDGSLGWAINLGAGANMFLGYFQPEVAEKLAKNPKFWIAGSGAAGGKALQTAGGYLVSGDWKYASGSNYATHFSMNVFLYDSTGNQLFDQEQNPIFRSFLVPADKVKVLETWQTLGLKNSCSNDFSLAETFIADDFLFDLTKPSEFSAHGLYRYPFWSFAVANIAVMTTGITAHFVEVFEQSVLPSRIEAQPDLVGLLDTLKQDLYQQRDRFFDAILELNQAVETGEVEQSLSTKQLEDNLQKQAKQTVDKAYDLVTKLYRHCGMHTVYNSNPLNKIVRDFFTATQHFVIKPDL